MRVPIFQVDAFTRVRFAGNPAAVMPLLSFFPDERLQAIAAENNLAETAFLVPRDGDYDLRWFTPRVEVPLCGHATLASAAVVIQRLEPGRSRVVFHSASGPLTVKREGDEYVMDFPARPSQTVAPPPGLAEALGAQPLEVRVNQFNYMALLESEKRLRELAPDMTALARIGRPGVIVTTAGKETTISSAATSLPRKGFRRIPLPAQRTACSRPIGRSAWARKNFAPIRHRPAEARSSADS
jgi:PhzF family phenazine biosynthesis protein